MNNDDNDDERPNSDRIKRPKKKKSRKRKKRKWPRIAFPRIVFDFHGSGGMASGGLLLIVIAVVWFVVGLMFGRIFYWPPFMVIFGILTILRALFWSE
jgi:hypothetical protein